MESRYLSQAWPDEPRGDGYRERQRGGGDEDTDCNHRQSSALSGFLLLWPELLVPQTCDLKLQGRARQKKEGEEEDENDDL